MKRLLVLAAMLGAMPVSGDQAQLSSAVHDVLTPLDLLPSKSDVDSAFMSAPALENLIAIARDPTMDVGVQIRAIRTLPLYCADAASCGAGAPTHDTLFGIVSDYVAALSATPPVALLPTDMLRLRAAIEALGATRSTLASDAELLTSQKLLEHDSRDVRFTVVHALRGIDSCAAVMALQRRNVNDGSDQVKLAIVAALQSLARHCM
jgi:HEAT repeat protein